MLPAGFLGTRGDILMDLVILAFVVILPMLVISWDKARNAQYTGHRRIQLSLALLLGVVVILFEIDLKMSGGIFVLTEQSRYSGTNLLNSLIYGHTLLAITSVVVWVGLVLVSLRRFGNPPTPGAFSARHRYWGRLGMLLMMGSGLSAMPLYYLGFYL